MYRYSSQLPNKAYFRREKPNTHVSLRRRRCSKASRPRELRDSSTSGPSMMSSLNGRALTINLWLSAPRDNTMPLSSLDNTERLEKERYRERNKERQGYQMQKKQQNRAEVTRRNTINHACVRLFSECHCALSDQRHTHGSVGGSAMSTSGTSKRGFRGFNSFIFTRVIFPCSLYSSNSKCTCKQQ